VLVRAPWVVVVLVLMWLVATVLWVAVVLGFGDSCDEGAGEGTLEHIFDQI